MGRTNWLVITLLLGAVLVVAGCAGTDSATDVEEPEAVVAEMLDAYGGGADVSDFWRPNTADVEREMMKFPPIDDYTVESVQVDGDIAIVQLEVTPEDGASLRYQVMLEKSGWGVVGVENDWRSSE